MARIAQYPNNWDGVRDIDDVVHRSCEAYRGVCTNSEQQIYEIQPACNGYSEQGYMYDGRSFRVDHKRFASGKTIRAEDYNDLIDMINRELARRADYNESTGKLVDGTIAEDVGEWHDEDFSEDYLGVQKAICGTYVEAKQANALIDAFLSKLDDPEYTIKYKNAFKTTVAKLVDVAAGDIVYGRELSSAALLLQKMQNECACYTDCDGYSVCYCYNHCNNY